MSDADDGFAALARSTVDGMLERRPELATLLGDHAHDGRLVIGTAEYHDELAWWCGGRLADLQRMDLDRLSSEYRVDAWILANQWSERQRHDELLAHGSPAPRHLRSLLLN